MRFNFDLSNPGGNGLTGTYHRRTACNGTLVVYTVGTDWIDITDVVTDRASRRQGRAREALSALLEQADGAGMEVSLFASPTRTGAASKRSLVQFYESLGFAGVPNSSTRMLRPVGGATEKLSSKRPRP